MVDLHPIPVESDVPAESLLGFHPVTFGISRLRTIFVNLYAVEASDGGFVLIDTGMAGTSALVKAEIAKRFGSEAKPRAILLTHAHVDHVGNAQILADLYDIPVYVHSLEKPYVTGGSDYPPADPTPGGAIAFFGRLLPTKGVDLGDRVKTLPKDGSVPELPGWRWIHTPGHTVGHVAYFREADRTAIVGDAFATADLDNWISVNTWPHELSRSPVPFVPDWEAAQASVLLLADLDPSLVAAGHGRPIAGDDLGERLRKVAEESVAPADARYAGRPAVYKADGSVASVPPPRPDPLPKKLAVAGAVAVLFSLALGVKKRRG